MLPEAMLLFLWALVRYGTLVLGLILLFLPSILQRARRVRLFHKLKQQETGRAQSLLARLDRLAEGALEIRGGGLWLAAISLLSGIILLSVSAPLLRFLPALMLSLFGFCLPVLLVKMRLSGKSRRSSFEGEALVGEMLRQYRICGCNIYECLEATVREGQGIRHSRKMLCSLLLELRGTGSPERIRECTDRFAYRMGTNWGRMLAQSIRTGAETGMNVSLALEDVLIQLREARSLAEERKRLNSESTRMVVFLVPLLYLGTVFLASRYLQVPLRRFLHNQFLSPEGLLFFFLLSGLFLLNLALLSLVNHQRFDF